MYRYILDCLFNQLNDTSFIDCYTVNLCAAMRRFLNQIIWAVHALSLFSYISWRKVLNFGPVFFAPGIMPYLYSRLTLAWSPIQVLTMAPSWYIQWYYGNWCFQHGPLPTFLLENTKALAQLNKQKRIDSYATSMWVDTSLETMASRL